ncbi:MAG: DegT/DnrJ/EryC1/StrS family aminotransferase [Pirellulales bacterium]
MKTAIVLPSDADSSGRSFDESEIDQLQRVIASGILNCTKGNAVRSFEARFAEWLGTAHCRCVSSGTAAIHTAVAAIDPEPGDEIISSPITDMGAITPIIYQTAIPVFADVDPVTFNITAEAIKQKITRRTRAVIVTHLFGNPCELGPILDLCNSHDIPVIEDCAQAYGARYRGRPVGTWGKIGCFSLQQGKHMTTGEGGMVVTDDQDLERRMRLFIDKAWGYGDERPDHYFLAPNYRMTELQGAVALAQLDKLDQMIEQRVSMAERLTERISDVPGIMTPVIRPDSRHTYWKYPLIIDEKVIAGGVDTFAKQLRDRGVYCAPRYVQKPAFECQVLRDRLTFGRSHFPFEGPHRAEDPPIVYDRAETPGTIRALSHIVVLPWNEKYVLEHIDFVSEVVREAAVKLAA